MMTLTGIRRTRTTLFKATPAATTIVVATAAAPPAATVVKPPNRAELLVVAGREKEEEEEEREQEEEVEKQTHISQGQYRAKAIRGFQKWEAPKSGKHLR